MVAGQGIAHPSTLARRPDLHGAAGSLPTDERHAERGLHHFTTGEVAHGGITARILGELEGEVGGRRPGHRAGAVTEDANFESHPRPAPRDAAELRMNRARR